MSETSEANKPYELVFEGPADDSDATLARIKSAFIAELEFSIPEVQEFLTKRPVTLRAADHPTELESIKRILTRAGANVSILRRMPEEEDEEPGSLELNIKLEDIGISLDDEDLPTPKDETVYVLPDAEDPDAAKPRAEPPKGKNAEELMQSLLALDSNTVTAPAKPPAAPESVQVVLEALDVDEEYAAPQPITASAPPPSKQERPETKIIERLDLSLAGPTEEILNSSKPSTPAPQEPIVDLSGLSLDSVDIEPPASKPAAEPSPSSTSPLVSTKKEEQRTESPLPSLSLDGSEPAPAVPVPAAPKEPPPPSALQLDSLKVDLAADVGAELIDSAVPATGGGDDTLDLLSAVEELTSGRVEVPPPAPDPATEPEVSVELEAESPPEPTPPAPKMAPPVAPRKPTGVTRDQTQTPETPKSASPVPVRDEPEVDADDLDVPKKKQRVLSLDTVVVVLIAGTLLLIGNWFYFSSFEELPITDPAPVKKAESVEVKAPEVPAKLEPVVEAKPVEVEPPPALYSGSAQDGPIRVEGILTGRVGSVSSGTLTLVTEPPPPLTNEEIVRKVIRRPWIVKVELENLRFERDRSGAFIARTPAKVYVDYRDERVRIMGSAIVRSSFPVSDKRAMVFLEVSHQSEITEFTHDEPQGSVAIEPSDDGLFSFTVSSRFTLHLEQMPE